MNKTIIIFQIFIHQVFGRIAQIFNNKTHPKAIAKSIQNRKIFKFERMNFI